MMGVKIPLGHRKFGMIIVCDKSEKPTVSWQKASWNVNIQVKEHKQIGHGNILTLFESCCLMWGTSLECVFLFNFLKLLAVNSTGIWGTVSCFSIYSGVVFPTSMKLRWNTLNLSCLQ